MDVSDLIHVTTFEIDKADTLIRQRKSFAVVGAVDTSRIANVMEKKIESAGLRCRVYSANRSAAMAGMVIPTGVTQVVGAFSALSIGIHNLLTFNCDYEICKCYVDNQVVCIYKK